MLPTSRAKNVSLPEWTCQPSAVRLAELRQLLEPGTLLLSYVLAEERSFLFLVSRDRLSSYVLPGRRR